MPSSFLTRSSTFTIQINSMPSKILFKFPVTHFPQVSNVNKISKPLHRFAVKVEYNNSYKWCRVFPVCSYFSSKCTAFLATNCPVLEKIACSNTFSVLLQSWRMLGSLNNFINILPQSWDNFFTICFLNTSD